ncbi:hypothetical protein ACQSSU_31690 [Micromonospora echinospora]
MIIEQADESVDGAAESRDPAPGLAPDAGVTVWPISARTKTSLAGQAARLADHVRTHGDLDPAAVGWSLATTRAVLDQRAAVVGADVEELLSGLDALAEGVPAGNVVAGLAGPSALPCPRIARIPSANRTGADTCSTQ